MTHLSPASESRQAVLDVHIATTRLRLREFCEDDWKPMAAWWADPRYRRMYPELDDVGQAVRDLIGRFLTSQTTEPRLIWQLAITMPHDDTIIGNCGIRIDNPVLRQANIGYELHPDQWGYGYATEAATAILRFGFEELGMHRVWAECVADNTGSAHVLEKLGMRREAHFREHQWYRDRWWDTYIYAILDHEWLERNATAAR
jgi:[ribosomal protein S5]-alanine N-acetyltransferase